MGHNTREIHRTAHTKNQREIYSLTLLLLRTVLGIARLLCLDLCGDLSEDVSWGFQKVFVRTSVLTRQINKFIPTSQLCTVLDFLTVRVGATA